MIIYLYVKTHSKTGLKYLGQTRRNPYTYDGSGIYWTRHLKKHGKEHTTEIIKECTSKDELKQWGLYYSNLWNVVNDTSWANLKSEDGYGGIMPSKVYESITKKKRERGTYPDNPEIIKKGLDTKKKNGTYGKLTKEAIDKRKKTMLERYGTLNTMTADMAKRISQTKLNAKIKRSAESIKKQKDTRKKRTYTRSKESNDKMLATRIERYGTTNTQKPQLS